VNNINKIKLSKIFKNSIFILLGFTVFLTLLASLLNWSSVVINIVATISTLSVILKVVVEVKLVGYEKIEHLETQNILGVYRMKVENLEKLLIEKIHSLEIANTQSVNVNTVEHQEIHIGSPTYEDEVISELRTYLDPVEIDAHRNGGLDGPFLSQPYDNLNIFVEQIETSRYSFRNIELNTKFVELKNNLLRFSELYHHNINHNNSPYIGIFEYTDMQRNAWRPNRWFTQEQMDKAKLELDEANDLLRSIIITYREFLDIYMKTPPELNKKTP